jgi:activator of HSP90 ATPase
MAITQEITFATSPQKLYSALTSSEEFSAATGAPADIATDEGGSFACFGGQITGRQLELLPNERIVQAWRAGPWDAGVYSIVRFDIAAAAESSILTLQHSGIPAGSAEHLEAGWKKMYWEPLKAWLG